MKEYMCKEDFLKEISRMVESEKFGKVISDIGCGLEAAETAAKIFPSVTKEDIRAEVKEDIKTEVIDEFVALCDEAKICETYYHVSMDAIRNIAKILKGKRNEK